MVIGPLLEKEFSKWPLNSKWPPFFLKNVIVDYSNTIYRIGLKFYMVIPYGHRISSLLGIFKMAARFKMAAIFVENLIESLIIQILIIGLG